MMVGGVKSARTVKWPSYHVFLSWKIRHISILADQISIFCRRSLTTMFKNKACGK